MKRRIILIITFIVILLQSCNNDCNDKASLYKNSDNSEIGELISKKFKYEGHQYIFFKQREIYGQTVVHDPECPCYKFK
jgi:hypothetical protein